MPVPKIPAQFNVYLMVDEGTKGQRYGGSYDKVTAVQIACTVFDVVQQLSPSKDRLVAVFDETDAIAAFIGQNG